MIKKKKILKYISSYEELASRIKRMRVLNKLPQRVVAEYLKVDRSTYAYYETNKTTPDIFTIIKLSYFYNIDISYFILEDNTIIKQYPKE